MNYTRNLHKGKGKHDGFNGLMTRRGKDKIHGISRILQVGTWNVRGLGNKETELNNELANKKVDVAVVTETKKKLSGTKELENYVMVYSGVPQYKRAACGVAILLHNQWKSKIVSYSYISERMVTLRMKTERGHLTVVGVYAPEEGKYDETLLFYESLQKVLNTHIRTDYVIVAGDLNARVGSTPIPGVVGCFGEDVINRNGQELRQFASFNKLKITNTFFRKKDIYKYTWIARGYRSLIDYVIVNEKMKNLIQDTRVYRGPEIGSDHYLVISEIKLLRRWKKFRTKTINSEEVYKVYLLQDDGIKYLYQQRLGAYLANINTENDINREWENIRACIEKSAHEVIGRRKKFRKRKGLKIWTEELEQAIKDKKIAYHKYLQTPSVQNEETYKSKRNTAKAIARRAHQQYWDIFVSNIEHDLHGRQEVAYKIIKHLNSQERDTARLNVIEDEEWKRHYQELWCQAEANRDEGSDISACVDMITLDELQQALRDSKNRKASGLDKINMELLKHGGPLFELRFLHLINECWRANDVPSAWNKAEVISLFKKGDRHRCDNYRGISLLNSAYKVYSRIINNRLKIITDALLCEEQSGFRKGRSCIDNVFIIQQLIEKRREFNLETHIAFIDFKKAFDKVNRQKLWEIMNIRGYPRHLIQALKGLYKRAEIVINTGRSISTELVTTQGVRQGCSISPTLFNIYIDHIIRIWKEEVRGGIKINSNTTLNSLLFADDLAIIQTTEDGLQRSVYTLETIANEYSLEISAQKTKIMAFKGKNPVR